MIFTVKVVYIMVIKKNKETYRKKSTMKRLGQTLPKLSSEIGSKLPYIYLTRYMQDFYCESSL